MACVPSKDSDQGIYLQTLTNQQEQTLQWAHI